MYGGGYDIDIVRAHIREMLEIRGDDVSYIEEHGDAVARPRYYTEFIELSTDKTTVMFALTKEVLKEVAKEFKETDVTELIRTFNNTPNFIIVVIDPPSSASNNLFIAKDKELSAIGGMLQIFQLRELMYNPSKHELVPKHEKLSDADAKEIMETYMIKTKMQMPFIHRSDKMARWLGLRQGDIVKITRYNETSGEYYYYRCCM